MEWTERGGPKLTQSPYHEGFGTSLVSRIVADQFGGEVSYDWHLEGLIVRLNMRSDRLVGLDDDVVLNSESRSVMELVGLVSIAYILEVVSG